MQHSVLFFGLFPPRSSIMARSATAAWLAVARALRMQRCSNILSQPSRISMAMASCSVSDEEASVIHARGHGMVTKCSIVGLNASDSLGQRPTSDGRIRGDQSVTTQTDDADLVCNATAHELSTISHPLRNHPQERQSAPATPNQLTGNTASFFRDTCGPSVGRRTSAASRKVPGSHLARYNLSTVPHRGAARIIDGRAVAEAIKRDVAADVALLRQGIVDASTLENHLPDPAEQEYRRSQHCGSLGVNVSTSQKFSGYTTQQSHDRGDGTGGTTSLPTQSQREGVRPAYMAATMLNTANTASSSSSRSSISHHSSSSRNGGSHNTNSSKGSDRMKTDN